MESAAINSDLLTVAADGQPLKDRPELMSAKPLRLDAASILQLRAFFELLDRWDRDADANSLR